MKQIFDWLREQINGQSYPDRLSSSGYFFEQVDTENVIDLINEAKAKWEADCCEWERLDRFSVIGHDIFFQIHNVRNYKYCPYCGKPIKISEVE